MKYAKKLLILLFVSLFALSAFVIGASAYTEPASLVGVDVNLEVGRYSGGVFTPLTPGEPLYANDIITVRIAPTTDFLAGITRYIVMFTKDYLQVEGAGKAAFTPNINNPFYIANSNDYQGATALPESAWPPALKSTALGGDGTYTTNNAVAVNNTAVGKTPDHLLGDWLFRFDLKVTQDITPGAGAKVWMAGDWIRKPGYTAGAMYFTKCLDSTKLSGTGSSTIYNFNVDLTGANIPLDPTNVNITWDANGGTGGTTTTATYGTMPTPPVVTRNNYTFTGWSPAIVAATEAATYTAQWSLDKVGVIVTLTKAETDMIVNIQGWEATSQYQIWTYQHITSDFLLDDIVDKKADQWILSKAYAAGSTGDVQLDGSINFTIDNFVSPDSNYTAAVRIIDNAGNFVSEIRDSYTPVEVSEVVITDTLVDGVVTPGYEIKEIDNDASVLIKVLGNGVAGTTYSATAGAGGVSLNLTANGNEFLWDISGLDPALYTVTVTATNGTTTDTQVITFKLYSLDTNITYASISDMATTWADGTASITPTFADGTFSYRVKEAGREYMYVSPQYSAAGTQTYGITAPGIYTVTGVVTRAGIIGTEEDGTYDDGIVRTLAVPRQGNQAGQFIFTLTADQPLPDVAKGTPIIFTAYTNLPAPAQYSFWRVDATGEVLVKDWSTSNTFAWTPARVGEYTIMCRAKGVGAGSYEATRTLAVNITDSVEAIAQVSSITINQAELVAGAQAKKPILIKAAATAATDDLLYKFKIYDDDMRGGILQEYSVNQNCAWTPREAGTFTISVLVKNSDSFGKYDAIGSWDIVVD